MIPPDSDLIGHGNLQQAATEWCGKHCLCYSIYVMCTDVELLDAIESAYGNGLSILTP